jgi:drug/metabolite transporter (DMT)-like permease
MIYLKLVCMTLLWGGAFISARVVIQQTEQPFSAAFLRFAIASGLLVVFVRSQAAPKPKLQGKHYFWLILLGLTGIFGYNALFFEGLKTVEASRAALIIANTPITIALLSAIFLKEKLTLIRIVGILLSVSGALVVISRGELSAFTEQPLTWGEGCILGCVLCWAIYALIGKVVMKDLAPLQSVTYSCVIGTVALFFPATAEGLFHEVGGYSHKVWLHLIYLGVFATVIGFIFFYQGIRRIGPVKTGLFINLVPIFAVILSVIFLRESVTISLLIGAALVISGVYLTNRKITECKTD